MHTLTFEAEDSIPADLKPFAKKTEDEKFAVTLVPQQKLNEFRDTNLNVVKDRDALKGVLGKLAPVIGEDYSKAEEIINEINELRKIKQEVDDGKLQGTTKIAEEVENRIGAMKSEHENAVKHLQTLLENEKAERSKAETRFKQTQIDRAVTEAVLKPESGARKDALAMFLREAYDVFRVDDSGQVIPYDREGKIIYGSDGATPMSAHEWLKKQSERFPFLFEGSQGGGANGGGSATMKIDQNLPPEERLRLAREAR